jgi:hypothetical protein
VEKGHEPVMRPVLETPHSNPPDALEAARKNLTGGILEVFERRRTVTEGPQSLELYTIFGNPHADPIVLAYLPRSRVLFQSDLFFPATGGAAGPAALHLLDAIRTLGLQVATNVGGHGGVAAFAELEKAAAAGAK